MQTPPEQSGQRLTRMPRGSRLKEVTARTAPSYADGSSLRTPATESVTTHEEDAGMIHSHMCAGRLVSNPSLAAAAPRGAERRTVR
jgi:hypothetical protein